MSKRFSYLNLDIGDYLEFACLPVGRGFGYWDLCENNSISN